MPHFACCSYSTHPGEETVCMIASLKALVMNVPDTLKRRAEEMLSAKRNGSRMDVDVTFSYICLVHTFCMQVHLADKCPCGVKHWQLVREALSGAPGSAERRVTSIHVGQDRRRADETLDSLTLTLTLYLKYVNDSQMYIIQVISDNYHHFMRRQ